MDSLFCEIIFAEAVVKQINFSFVTNRDAIEITFVEVIDIFVQLNNDIIGFHVRVKMSSRMEFL